MGLVFLLWGLLFQGSRGIWEPDEGFYSNVGLGMARSGDWVVPRLNGEPFLDKPPLHYWSMAAGMLLLGENEWGARLGQALWFLLTAWLIGAIAARLWGDPRLRLRGAAIYAVSLLPFLAANAITTDTPLAFWAALAAYAYVRSREQPERWRWMLLCGGAVGFGMLTKGPAALMLAAPLGLDSFFGRRHRPWLPDLLAAAVAAALGASWYLAIAHRLPGALDYILDNQVTGRLVNGTYGRNPGWRGALIYIPVLLLGALPWSMFWPGWIRRLWDLRRAPGGWRLLRDDPAWRLVTLWLLLPLLVLLAAQSRLPLYALPLLSPLALCATRLIPEPGLERGRFWQLWKPALGGWCLLLLVAKAVPAYWPQDADSRAMAAALAKLEPDRATPILMMEVKRNGLKMYGFDDLRPAAVRRAPYKFFVEVPPLADVLASLQASHVVILLGGENLEKTRRILAGTQWTCTETKGPFRYHFFSCREGATARRPA